MNNPVTGQSTEIRRVDGQPEARAAEPCDEHCDVECVHHTPNVGWDLSFGSRLNFHPVDTTDGRLVVALHLSDDAVATGMVYRRVEPEQVLTFARQLLALIGTEWRPVLPPRAGVKVAQTGGPGRPWCNGLSIGTAARCGASNRHAPHGEGEQPAWFDHD